MSPVVHLHIGAPKSGTTFLQAVIEENRERIASAGVHVPGNNRRLQREAVREIRAWSEREEDDELPQLWQRVAQAARAWSGPSVLVSMEWLTVLTEEQIRVVMDSLAPCEVRVVITVRDLGRVLPAQWQTSLRQRQTWTLTKYVAGVRPRRAGSRAHRHFWRRHDTAAIVRRWASFVGMENVTVVTVPQPGNPPSLLWERFAGAVGIDADGYTMPAAQNLSAGAASAEVMRRVNATRSVQAMTSTDYRAALDNALFHGVLDPRRSLEPPFVLPEAAHRWVGREADRVTAELAELGVRVVGDLADLQPVLKAELGPPPEGLPAEDVLTAAIEGLAGLAVDDARLRADVKARKAAQAEMDRRPLLGRVARRARRGPGSEPTS